MGIFDLITKGVGKALIGGVKMGMGFAVGAGHIGLGTVKLAGKGLQNTAPVIGRGIWNISKSVGKTLTGPFETAENRRRTALNYVDVLKSVGNTIVHENKEGNMRLTKTGLGLIGGITLANKLNDNYYEAKSKVLGTVDQKPTTATPNYNPVQYEMSPPRRIHPDSGGATGDLVFALHKLR